MSDLTPVVPDEPTRITAERYFALVEEGALAEDDRVELLEGVIVAMPPPNPPHDSGTTRMTVALLRAVGSRAVVRPQCSLVVGHWSVPQPDFAVVPGTPEDYDEAHPRTALLVVEISDTSLPQDRLSKARIYAAAGIPEYWILNLRARALEVLRDPHPASAVYRDRRVLAPGDAVEIAALPGARVEVAALLPPARGERG
jgi:Uma2 family endonuclease